MTADTELLTVPEVMDRLKISRSTVYDLIRTRQLASLTIGRARRIPALALTDFIRQHPGVDPQEGRTLIRNARKEREQAKPPRYFRELFQWIKTAAGVEDEEDESLNEGEAEDEGVEFPEREDDDGYKA